LTSRAASAADGLAPGAPFGGSPAAASASATFAAISGMTGTGGGVEEADVATTTAGTVSSRLAAARASFREPNNELRACGPATALDMGGSWKKRDGVVTTNACAGQNGYPAPAGISLPGARASTNQ
jgi:hypothetical protein